MNRNALRFFASLGFSLTLVAGTVLLSVASTKAQCSEVTSNLRNPVGLVQSNKNNLIVSETGAFNTSNSGRISIVDLDGHRRTLLDRLPSGTNAAGGDPSGPAGIIMRGRTLYVAIGQGDAVIPAPPGSPPGSGLANPNPSSPIFSSILAIHFSANVEKTTRGFTLSIADQRTLAGGHEVTLSNGRGDKITIQMVADFPDFIPNPLPTLPQNVRNSNPFDLVAVGDQLYVTNGGLNLLWQVDIQTGAFSVVTTFPPITNPLFPSVGGPSLEAVPTGIAYFDGQLLVTLFRGFPFPPGVSVVEQVDPLTGNHSPFITGLRTAIDVIPIREGSEIHYLVLQHTSSVNPPFLPPFTGPGNVLHFDTPAGPPTVVTNCLTRPTAMTFDEKSGLLYVTELRTGRIVEVAGAF